MKSEKEAKGSTRFYNCACFTTDNIFLDDYNIHVRFVSEQQFRLDYRSVSVVNVPTVILFVARLGWCVCTMTTTFGPQVLWSLGCVTELQFEDVLTKASKVKLGMYKVTYSFIKHISFFQHHLHGPKT